MRIRGQGTHMATTAKALREKQEAVEKAMRQHRDKITADDYKFDAADEAAWTRMNTEHNELASQIRQIESLDDVLKERENGKEDTNRLRHEKNKKSRKTNPDAPLDAEERSTAINGYLFRFIAGATALISGETRQAMEKANRQGVCSLGKRGLKIQLSRATDLQAKQRALAFGGGAGNVGTLGVANFVERLEVNMLAHGPMAQVATVIRSDNGRDLNAPYGDDTANEGDIVGEAAAVSATADPTFSQQVWKAWKLRSKKVIYSSEAEEDSFFDLFNVLADMLGERLGRGENRYCTTGTGTSQHEGVTVGAALGVTAAANNAFTSDELINLEHSVDVAYRLNCAYMMHDTVLAFVRKLKYSGTGQYIFDFGKGGNGTINGHNVQINNHMASAFTTAQRLVVWGDFKKYILRQVNAVRLRRNVELHSDNDQESIQAFMRSDGKIQNSGTAPIKYLRLL